MIPNTPEAWSAQAELADPYEAVRWSRAGQQARFAAVLTALDPQPGDSLLDYGCGTGSLSTLVSDDVHYLGYDWSEGMLARARRDHPEARFTATLPRHSFDITAFVGPFNLRDGWTKRATWATITERWASTGRALAASLYAGDDPDCLIYLDDEVLGYAARLAPLWRVERHRRNDLLLVLRRD